MKFIALAYWERGPKLVKGLDATGRYVGDTEPAMHLTDEVHERGQGTPERLLLRQECCLLPPLG